MRNCITIGSDKKLFDESSDVVKRQIINAEPYDRFIIVIPTRRGYEKKKYGKIEVIPTNSINVLFGLFSAIFIIRKYVKDESVQSIVSAQDPFENGLVAALAIIGTDALLHIQLHTDPFSPFFAKTSILNKVRTKILPYVLSKARLVRVVSNKLKDEILARNFKADIIVKPIPVDKEKIVNSPITIDLKKTHNYFSKIIVMCTRLEKEKNVSLAIDVFFELQKKLKNVGLVILGDGSEMNKLKAMVETYSLDGNVVFMGWQKPADVYSCYKTADVFLQTSLYEGYGLSLVEASFAGGSVPVSSDVGVARELLPASHVFSVNDKKACLDILFEILK